MSAREMPVLEAGVERSAVPAAAERSGSRPRAGLLAARAAPLLPALIVFGVAARLLESPLLAAGALALFVLPLLPGVALHRWLRPWDDPIGRIAGGLALGVPPMMAAFVAAERLGWRSAWGLAALLAAPAALALLRPRARPLRRRPAGAARWAGLAALLLLAAVMFLPPALSAASEQPDGSRAFVKNFGFDFLRHTTFTAATARGPVPPANLFLEGRRVESYWLYYSGPALVARGIGEGPGLYRIVLTCNFLIACLLLALLWAGLGRGWGGALAGGLAAFVFWAAPGWRGVAHAVPFLSGLLEEELKFVFTVPLYFALFMGHHMLAMALLLAAVSLYRPGSAGRMLPRAAATGVLLPVIAVVSPFVGAVAIGWFLLHSLWAVGLRPRRRARAALEASVALLPLAGGFVLYTLVFGAGFSPVSHSALETKLDFTLLPLPLHLAICMGPLLLLAAAGLSSRRLRAPRSVSVLMLALASLLTLSFLVVRNPKIEETTHEVGTKAGMILMLALAFPAAAGIARLLPGGRRTVGAGRVGYRRAAAVAAGLAVAGGLAGSAAYVHAYSDVSRADLVPAADWRAVEWIRANLPPEARIVISASGRHGPKNYSVIPPFAHRQLLRGTKGVFTRGPDDRAQLEEIDALYSGRREIVERWAAERPGWYVFCGGAERLVNERAVEDLKAHPDLLETVYERDGVAIFRFRPAVVPAVTGGAAGEETG